MGMSSRQFSTIFQTADFEVCPGAEFLLGFGGKSPPFVPKEYRTEMFPMSVPGKVRQSSSSSFQIRQSPL
jgi:uncharacterized protein (DUF169 family)